MQVPNGEFRSLNIRNEESISHTVEILPEDFSEGFIIIHINGRYGASDGVCVNGLVGGVGGLLIILLCAATGISIQW